LDLRRKERLENESNESAVSAKELSEPASPCATEGRASSQIWGKGPPSGRKGGLTDPSHPGRGRTGPGVFREGRVWNALWDRGPSTKTHFREGKCEADPLWKRRDARNDTMLKWWARPERGSSFFIEGGGDKKAEDERGKGAGGDQKNLLNGRYGKKVVCKYYMMRKEKREKEAGQRGR